MSDVKNYSVFRLAWPIFLQMLLSMFLGYADTIMLSRYSELAVGAVGNANQITGFLTLAFNIVSGATAVIVAQYLGAKKNDSMDKIYTAAFGFNLFISVFICAILVVFRFQLLAAIRIPDTMLEGAAKYLSITGCFLFCNALINVFLRIFNCNGKTSIGMYIIFLMNILNIIGNYLFLYGPLSFLNLGITGVAFSTSLSHIAGVIAAYVCFRKIIKGTISIKFLIPLPKDILLKLLKLGCPAAGENIFYNISQLCITAFVNTIGAQAVTAKIFCNILCGFSLIYSNSVAGATAIITGHAVGGEDYDFAYKRVFKSLLGALAVSCAVACANWLLSPLTLKLFTDNKEIIHLCTKIMFIIVFLELGRTVNLVIIQSMRAAGDVVFPTVLGICSMWGISVVFAWVLGIGFKFGLPGVWWAMAADEIFRAVIVFIRWQKGSWRGKNVASKSE
ncbi:MAG: MATE family efflux transporter [Treponema sp.]